MSWEQTENEIKHTIQSPDNFNSDSFKTKKISDGVSIIIGKKPNSDKMGMQALCFDISMFNLEKAKSWYNEHKGTFEQRTDFSLPETFDLSDVEIFAEGIWNGDKYTKNDLESIIEGFNETKNALKPYVKLGHNPDQILLKNDGLPAAGWITNLKMKGKKLLADISGMPKKIYDLIKAGAYKRVSSEIFFDIEISGKKYPKLLKAIALLGSDTPAVSTLDDIISLYSLEDIINKKDIAKTYEIDRNELKNYGQGDPKMKELMDLMKKLMDKMGAGEQVDMAEAKSLCSEIKKHYKFEFDKSAEELKKEEEVSLSLKAKDETLAQKDKELKDLGDKNTELTQKLFSIEINKKVDELILGKKITPAQKDYIIAMLTDFKGRGETKKYKIGEIEKGIEDIFSEFTNTLEVKVNTEGLTETGEKQLSDEPDEKTGFQGEATHKAVLEYMSKNKITDYKKALLEVNKQKAK